MKNSINYGVFIRLALGWPLGFLFGYLIFMGFEAHVSYSLICGWWLSAVLLKGSPVNSKTIATLVLFSLLVGIVLHAYRSFDQGEQFVPSYHLLMITVSAIVFSSPLGLALVVSFVESLAQALLQKKKPA